MHREFSNLSWGTIGSGARWLMSTTQIKKEIKYQIQHDPTSRIILPILQHPIQNLSCPHRPIYIRPVFGTTIPPYRPHTKETTATTEPSIPGAYRCLCSTSFKTEEELSKHV
ncbi:MAG: hypothetical protein WAK17_14385 [Candidatus Nitrosopolaris sp.]|jgi:hypothetical protein